MVYLPDEEALDEFVAREDRLQQEESDRYGNTRDDRFTVLYYPQSRYDYNVSKAVLASMDFAVVDDPSCARCRSHVRYSTFRRVRGDSEYCVDCLKKMGCCILPGSDNVLFPDLIAMIMSFLPEYYHATRAARVSKMWLSCFNFDHTHESGIMALKRLWISREIYFRNMLSSPNYEVVQAFIARFDLGALLGDWIDDSFKSRYHWLKLCCSIAESAHYTKLYGIERSRTHGIPTYTQEAGSLVMSVRLNNDASRSNVYRIPSALLGGGTIQAVLHDPDASFSARLHTKYGEVLDVVFDTPTGTVAILPDSNAIQRPWWYCCIFC
ncbi:Hypothetical protein, putative [Bodo saltans]|uniref:Uncharacterized protein n=1 Tax=Bodo saltans TaxID=75058 RepID=A0A0S4J3X5_BODSA|nr:Hypothetical protein, putative [Bodo saltans]|eukprot:CUG86141.1 Hypothetical protein, putative [Bodo saltans]